MNSRDMARKKMVSGLSACEPVTSPLVCAIGSENPIQFACQSLIKETSLGHHLMLGSAGQFVYSVCNGFHHVQMAVCATFKVKIKSKSEQNPSIWSKRGKMTQTGKIRLIRTIRLINPEDSSPVLRAVMWGWFNCPTVVGTPLGTVSGDPTFPRKVGGVSEEASSNHKIIQLNILYNIIKSNVWTWFFIFIKLLYLSLLAVAQWSPSLPYFHRRGASLGSFRPS